MASTGPLRRSQSSGTLRKSGEVTIGGSPTGASQGALTKHSPPPAVPKYLSVHALTRRRKLSQSTGNLHGYMAEDYHQINWPLPKMFGMEKYGYSLIDIQDPRYLKECAAMSKKLVRLSYDQQIIDLEWRKTYKALLDAEHRQATLPINAQQKTKDMLKKEVDGYMKYLLELQEQKESDLEDLRMHMEQRTRDKLDPEQPFWRTKFNIHSSGGGRTGGGMSFNS